MSEFEVNPPEICSICGEVKEPEELSELDGQVACLDCIAQANVSKNIPLEQLAAAAHPTPTHHAPPPRSALKRLIAILFFFILPIAGAAYMYHLRHRQEMIRNSVTSLKAEGDELTRAGKLDQALARYEAVLKQLQGRPLSDPQLVELYHQAEKSAASPYHRMIMPRLEHVEALLLASRNEEARGEFRDLASFINAHTVQPEISIRERIDHVTDQLKVPRIAKANWRKEIPPVAIAPQPDRMTIKPVLTPKPTEEPTPAPPPQVTDTASPQAQPNPLLPPALKPTRTNPPQPVSVPDPELQLRAQEQIRTRFADKYAQRDALSRRALAHLLFITAEEPQNDSTTRFVLLRESRDLAAHAAEPRIALAAVDELSKSFLINDVTMRMTALAESAQNAFTAESNQLIAETALDLVDRMAAERHLDEAYRCALIANTAAQQSRQPSLISKSTAKMKEFAQFKR